jgi:hypothetical protein
MKKRMFTKPVGIVLDEETYDLLTRITDHEELSRRSRIMQ